MKKHGNTKNLEAFVLEKLINGKFATISTIPSGKSMEFMLPAITIKVTNRGPYFLMEQNPYSNHDAPDYASITVNQKNIVKSIAPLMGRAAGSATSKAKAKAARENGKKGGRPRKVSDHES